MASFDEVIPPGKAGSIKASVHTANLKGDIGKSIAVTHDDKTQGPISLTLHAKLVGSVDVYPFAGIQIARPPRGFETPAQVIIRQDPTEKGKLAFDGLSSSVDWVKASARTVTADEPAAGPLPAAKPGDVVLSVKVEKPPVGTHVERVTFKTGLPREPAVTIPVTVMIQPAVTLQPALLILSPDPTAPGGANGNVLAAIREDLDPKTVTVTSEAPAFSVRTDPPGERAFRVIVDWAGKGPKPPTETTIHIKVGQETIDLPVRVNLTEAPKPS